MTSTDTEKDGYMGLPARIYTGAGHECSVTPLPGTEQPRYGMGPLHEISCGCGYRQGPPETIDGYHAAVLACQHLAEYAPRQYAQVWLMSGPGDQLWLTTDGETGQMVIGPEPGGFQAAAADFLASSRPEQRLPPCQRQACCWPAMGGALTWHRAVNYPGRIPWDVTTAAGIFIDGDAGR